MGHQQLRMGHQLRAPDQQMMTTRLRWRLLCLEEMPSGMATKLLDKMHAFIMGIIVVCTLLYVQ